MERQEFEMSEEELNAILGACRPVPYMVIGGVPPTSPQENANRAWQALGEKRGFDFMTVRPLPEKGDRFFTAIPTKPNEQKS